MIKSRSFLDLENFRLECGTVLPQAHLVYQTYGELAGDRSNAILYPTSYGAQQAYHWGVLYSDRVARIAALCGTVRTTDHNTLFLQSLRTAIGFS